ncbi:MAG: hypothetical protein LBH56_04830 [Coriobacteriales bacterium]|nr:hypothetical protein [Coriobacteriales bacterium]
MQHISDEGQGSLQQVGRPAAAYATRPALRCPASRPSAVVPPQRGRPCPASAPLQRPARVVDVWGRLYYNL